MSMICFLWGERLIIAISFILNECGHSSEDAECQLKELLEAIKHNHLFELCIPDN